MLGVSQTINTCVCLGAMSLGEATRKGGAAKLPAEILGLHVIKMGRFSAVQLKRPVLGHCPKTTFGTLIFGFYLK